MMSAILCVSFPYIQVRITDLPDRLKLTLLGPTKEAFSNSQFLSVTQ